MATIGYLRESKNAHTMNRNLRLLRRAGVALSSITIGGDVMPLIDGLSCGDCLVVLSVSELSPQTARQQMLLKRIADKGIVFRPLNKIDTTPILAPENLMGRLLRKLGIRISRGNNSAAETDLQANAEPHIRITDDCLKSYYGLKENVESICKKAQIHPRILYDFLQKNRLPSRREVKVKPKLNPLRRSGFPENLRGSRSNGEKA